jgi:hypothetical protein
VPHAETPIVGVSKGLYIRCACLDVTATTHYSSHSAVAFAQSLYGIPPFPLYLSFLDLSSPIAYYLTMSYANIAKKDSE